MFVIYWHSVVVYLSLFYPGLRRLLAFFYTGIIFATPRLKNKTLNWRLSWPHLQIRRYTVMLKKPLNWGIKNHRVNYNSPPIKCPGNGFSSICLSRQRQQTSIEDRQLHHLSLLHQPFVAGLRWLLDNHMRKHTVPWTGLTISSRSS